MNAFSIKLAGIVAALSLPLSAGLTTSAVAADEVNVYSYRQPQLMQPLFDDFTNATGIKVNQIFAKKGLIERMAAEGRNSPADVLLTVDIGRLASAVEQDVAQPLNSTVLNEKIPAQYRDSKGRWFGLTTRARVIYASRDRVKADTISYEELADPKWKGRICLRSGQHVYNVALFASMVANKGEEFTRKWLEGLKNNLARKPSGNDRAQAKSIHAGECDIGLANTYYMGKMETNTKKPEQQEWAKSIRVIFPNSGDRGTHVNLSGMVLAKHAPNKDNAVKLMEFLASERAQKLYAEVNFEYPVSPKVAASDRVKSWGELKPDSLSLEKIAELRKKASMMVDEVRFNDGPSS